MIQLESPYEFHPHQLQAIQWVHLRENEPYHGVRGGILHLDMGLGKTLIALSLAKMTPGLTLYLCNKSLVRTVYQDSVRFFGDRLRILVWYKDSIKTAVTDFGPWCLHGVQVVLTTYDTIITLSRCDSVGARTFFGTQWYRIVADESHRIANARTNLYSALNCLRGERKLCLTGTPIRNYDNDLLAQLQFCGLDLQGRSWSRGVFEELNLQTTVLHIHTSSTTLELPELVEKIIHVELSIQEHSLYLAEIRSAENCKCVLTTLIRLRQLCLHPKLVYPDWSGNSSKFLQLVEVLSAIPSDEKIIIFSEFAQLFELLQPWLASHTVAVLTGKLSSKDRNAALQYFRTTARVLLISSVGTVGLNLVEANHCVILDQHWNFTRTEQFKKRCHRFGQLKPVTVWIFIVPDSIDEIMLEVSRAKKKLSDSFLLKRVLELAKNRESFKI